MGKKVTISKIKPKKGKVTATAKKTPKKKTYTFTKKSGKGTIGIRKSTKKK